MNKWKVFQSYIGRGWAVRHRGKLGIWHFSSWREAMDYADRMARTVEVVLPRLTALPTGRHTVQRDGLVIEFEQSRSQPQLQPGYLVVEPWERRPLALALLALAEQEENGK